MSLKEKMMESMMGNMSKQEKMEMMDKMMEQFFSVLSDEDKKELMQTMMPKMMQRMMGAGSSGMMGMMMQRMRGGEGGPDELAENEHSDFNPADMCKTMISSIQEGQKVATLVTPEIRGLFEDWVEQIEEEIFQFLINDQSSDIDKLAEHFKISKESVHYFILGLTKKGKINIQVMQH